MAPRPFWKGYLKLSLVTCPVAMTPATSDSEKIRFHTVNRKTGHRVQSRYVDAVTGKPVGDSDEIKGYPVGEDSYVTFTDEELGSVALESTRTIDIDMFVPADSIGWVWLDKPHFLTPDDKVGEEAFSVIREAMRATGKVALSRVVLYRRERAVMLEPRGNGIVLWTLRYGDEVRDPEPYFENIEDEKPDSEMMTLVRKLIEERSTNWSPKLVEDPVQEKLRSIIEAKKKKKPVSSVKPAKDKAPVTADNVVSILDALKRSVAAEKKGKG